MKLVPVLLALAFPIFAATMGCRQPVDAPGDGDPIQESAADQPATGGAAGPAKASPLGDQAAGEEEAAANGGNEDSGVGLDVDVDVGKEGVDVKIEGGSDAAAEQNQAP